MQNSGYHPYPGYPQPPPPPQ
uniref:Uncharacterized protein n=1 Tax=Arundo donax TaxID=35708 RepID=A0A0A9BVK7_ARUDO